MKHLTLLLILLTVLTSQGIAQERANTLYFEGLGNAGLYSINYERLVSPIVAIRGGFSYLRNGTDAFFPQMSVYLFPLSISYLVGEGTSKFELAGGGTIITGDIDWLGSHGSGTTVLPNVTIGYRYQSEGFLFRLGLTPLMLKDRLVPWAGISFGAVF